jgi:hypothetical protein
MVTKKAILKLGPQRGPIAYQISEHGLEVLTLKSKEVKIRDF